MTVANIRRITYAGQRGKTLAYVLETLSGNWLIESEGSPFTFDRKGRIIEHAPVIGEAFRIGNTRKTHR